MIPVTLTARFRSDNSSAKNCRTGGTRGQVAEIFLGLQHDSALRCVHAGAARGDRRAGRRQHQHREPGAQRQAGRQREHQTAGADRRRRARLRPSRAPAAADGGARRGGRARDREPVLPAPRPADRAEPRAPRLHAGAVHPEPGRHPRGRLRPQPARARRRRDHLRLRHARHRRRQTRPLQGPHRQRAAGRAHQRVPAGRREPSASPPTTPASSTWPSPTWPTWGTPGSASRSGRTATPPYVARPAHSRPRCASTSTRA